MHVSEPVFLDPLLRCANGRFLRTDMNLQFFYDVAGVVWFPPHVPPQLLDLG
jgi:hypothetical protein